MEENNKTKEVKMAVENADKDQQKYTYEQLNEICGKLFNENQYLRQQHQRDMQAITTINRLDYLLRIIEISSKRTNDTYNFNPDFVLKCLDEIEKIMTPPVEEEKENSKEN